MWINWLDLESKQKLESKIKSWIRWWAIGDALWAPVEMRTKENINEFFGKVTTYLSVLNNGWFEAKWFPESWGGYVTDDTLLSLALIKSYNELGDVDLADVFKKHQEAYDSFPYGFGGATKFGMRNIKEWTPLTESWQKGSAGNGVVMKQFPLAAIASVKDIPDEEMAELINTYTRATHDSDLAAVSSIVHHKFLKTLLETEPNKLNKKELTKQLVDFIKPYEAKYPESENKISDLLISLNDMINEETNTLDISDDEIIAKFGRWELDPNNPRDIFKSWYVLFTLGMVYALFLRNQDFEWLIDTINIGGDVDSNAAIIGNMIGAYQGIEYPEYYTDGLQKKDEIRTDTNEFIAKVFDE